MLGTDLQTFAADLAQRLGVPVEVDPRDLVLPGILVNPGPIDFTRLAGNVLDVTAELWLIAADSNPVTALDELADLLIKLREYLGGDLASADPITVTLPSLSPDPLPGLLCPYPLTLTTN